VKYLWKYGGRHCASLILQVTSHSAYTMQSLPEYEITSRVSCYIVEAPVLLGYTEVASEIWAVCGKQPEQGL